jgi:predicted transporter
LGGNLLGLLLALVGLVFLFWFAIILPAQMATTRRRSAFLWICISLVGSPLLAILLLLALGEAQEKRG